MKGKTGFMAFSAAIVASGVLAVPALAGEDELRIFDVGSFDVVGEGGGDRERGDVVEVEVEYDCQDRDELSDQNQTFAVGLVVRQDGTNDPDAEGSGIRQRDCDRSDDRDRVIVPVKANAGSAQFDGDEPFTYDAVGLTFISNPNGFTDLDFESTDGGDNGGT